MARRQFATINHFEQPEDFLAQRMADSMNKGDNKDEEAEAPKPAVVETHNVASSPMREEGVQAPSLKDKVDENEEKIKLLMEKLEQ